MRMTAEMRRRDEDRRRKLQVAMNQEWAQVSRVRTRVRKLAAHPIPPLAAAAARPVVATVAADGGENCLLLEPMRIQIIRVADSAGEVYFEKFIPHSVEPRDVIRFFFQSNERVQRLLRFLDLGWEHLLPQGEYQRGHLLAMLRELLEWATILRLASDAPPRLILRDGLLRSVLLPDLVFERFRERLEEAAQRHGHLLAGVAKRSAVINYLSLAFSLEASLPPDLPSYAPVPPELEQEAAPTSYRWMNQRSMGALHLARLDRGEAVPILPVDVASAFADRAPEIMALLAREARGSFPLRGYPAPLLDAHERARLSALETEILQAWFLDELSALDAAAAREARELVLHGREFVEEVPT